MALIVFDPPERFVVGTVGPAGSRTFFLQAAGSGVLYSTSLEKMQVAVLAERIDDLLIEHGWEGFNDEPVIDNGPLALPIEDEFRVVTLALAWDQERDVIIIECHDDDPEVEPPNINTMRVVLEPAAARAFTARAQTVVAAGRPPCPFCGQPLDPSGHICPRANGYRR